MHVGPGWKNLVNSLPHLDCANHAFIWAMPKFGHCTDWCAKFKITRHVYEMTNIIIIIVFGSVIKVVGDEIAVGGQRVESQDLQTHLNLTSGFTGSVAKMFSKMSFERWFFRRWRICGCGVWDIFGTAMGITTEQNRVLEE